MYYLIPILFLVADRALKYLKPVYYNYDGPFGLGFSGIILNIISIIVVLIFLGLFIYEVKRKNILSSVSILFILLGGASNLFDRLFYGYVVDYLQIPNWSYFNFADVMLIGGVVILLIMSLRGGTTRQSREYNAE